MNQELAGLGERDGEFILGTEHGADATLHVRPLDQFLRERSGIGSGRAGDSDCQREEADDERASDTGGKAYQRRRGNETR